MDAQPSCNVTQRSPLDFVACSSCHRPFSSSVNSPSFYLTTCAHTICEPCLFPPPATAPLPPDAPCPCCHVQGAVILLSQANLNGNVDHYFRPVADMLGDLGMATEWQMQNLAQQLEFFKTKCADQKKMLAKAGGKLKKAGGLKAQLDQLSAENASLRSQLAAASSAQLDSRRPRQAQHDPNEQVQHNIFARNDAQLPRGEKRKARRSPDRNAGLPLQPATYGFSTPHDEVQHPASRHSRAESQVQYQPLDFQLPPSRLSFNPAQSNQTKERQRQASRKGVGVQGSGSSRDGGGQGGERRSTRPDESRGIKERLQQFAYNPSRNSHRPADGPAHPQSAPALAQSRSSTRTGARQPLTAQPAATPSFQQPPPTSQPRKRAQYHPPRVPADFSSSALGGSNPFFYQAPPSPQQARPQLSASYAQSKPQGYSGGFDEHVEEEREYQEMPPPPVPGSSRIAQQSGSRQFISARQVQQEQQSHGGQHGGYHQPPASPFVARGSFTPASYRATLAGLTPPASTPLPSFVANQSASSHRQPFRPAGGGTEGQGGGGGGYQAGRFPQLPNFAAWSTVDDYPLQVHSISQETNRTIGYVEAAEGKRFKVHYADCRDQRPEQSYAVRVEVDGKRADGRITNREGDFFNSQPWKDERITTIKGAEAGPGSIRPLSFSRLALTEDENLALSSSKEIAALGTIKLSYRRIESMGEVKAAMSVGEERRFGPEKTNQTGISAALPVHERARKAEISHRTTLGKEVKVKAAKKVKCVYMDKLKTPFATIEILYRSKDILEAEGHIPKPRQHKSYSSLYQDIRDEEKRIEEEHQQWLEERREREQQAFQDEVKQYRDRLTAPSTSAISSRTLDFPPAKEGFARMLNWECWAYARLQFDYKHGGLSPERYTELVRYMARLNQCYAEETSPVYCDPLELRVLEIQPATTVSPPTAGPTRRRTSSSSSSSESSVSSSRTSSAQPTLSTVTASTPASPAQNKCTTPASSTSNRDRPGASFASSSVAAPVPRPWVTAAYVNVPGVRPSVPTSPSFTNSPAFVFQPAQVGVAGMTVAHCGHYQQLQECFGRDALTFAEIEQLRQYVVVLAKYHTTQDALGVGRSNLAARSSSVTPRPRTSSFSSSSTTAFASSSRPSALTRLPASPSTTAASACPAPATATTSTSASSTSLSSSSSSASSRRSPPSPTLADLEAELELLKRQERILQLEREIRALKEGRGDRDSSSGGSEAESRTKRGGEPTEEREGKRVKREVE
ncbi:hypothetical protein JCM11641_000619 [Rhodosporidiobolus odoratus]